MFLLRAAFWIMAVTVLMPREPDLGMAQAADAGVCAMDADCIDPAQWLQDFRAMALTSLARVRAELEAQERG
jgi:hypothetical protein